MSKFGHWASVPHKKTNPACNKTFAFAFGSFLQNVPVEFFDQIVSSRVVGEREREREREREENKYIQFNQNALDISMAPTTKKVTSF